jgi:hypothetical protein
MQAVDLVIDLIIDYRNILGAQKLMRLILGIMEHSALSRS